MELNTDSLNTDQLQMWIETGIGLVADFAPKVVGVLFIFIIGRFIAGKMGRLVNAAMNRAKVDATLGVFFGNLARYLILTVAALAALEMFGIKTTSIAGILAAAGFAVGLALQGSLSNFSAGVMLLLFRPYGVGDVINAGGSTGEVTELNLFTTVLVPPSGEVITIPNGAIFGGTITNFTPATLRMAAVDVGAAYDADIDKTQGALEAAIAAIPGVQKSQVVLLGLGASSVDYQLRVWVPNDQWIPVHHDVIRAAKYGLEAANIGIPYQTLDVNLIPQG